MDHKYKVGGYVKLAKLWERSKDAAVAYHSSYYVEKFRDDADKRLVGVYIDITGNKEIYKRPEMVHLRSDCNDPDAEKAQHPARQAGVERCDGGKHHEE